MFCVRDIHSMLHIERAENDTTEVINSQQILMELMSQPHVLWANCFRSDGVAQVNQKRAVFGMLLSHCIWLSLGDDNQKIEENQATASNPFILPMLNYSLGFITKYTVHCCFHAFLRQFNTLLFSLTTKLLNTLTARRIISKAADQHTSSERCLLRGTHLQ